MKYAALALVGAVSLAGCATQPTEPAGPATAAVDASSPLAAPMYMQMAASSDQFEIQSSQMALQMSQNQAVRSFASMMIAHHTATTNNLVAAATSAGLTPPPPALLPDDQAMLDQLRAAGSNFDAAYRDAQVMGHQKALA